AAAAWGDLELGDEQRVDLVGKKFPTQNVGKAARLQLAFKHLWFGGVRQLGLNANEAKNNILTARDQYERLALDCKYDPGDLGAALYGLAVIEETSALDDVENLKSAVTAYKRVVKEAKDSAFAKWAQERIDVLDVPPPVDGEDAKAKEDREARQTRL